ncbi:MAG: class I SAM-dependent methyltransferase [Propionibacteriaceae bacterium]|nr:class I SAM-dependent methyltransferase [Propionibacteriaceae bacterium]
MPRVDFPEAALTWLTADCEGQALVLAPSGGVPRLIAGAGQDVVTVTSDLEHARRFVATPHVTPVVGRAESLPFVGYHFGLVLVHQMAAQLSLGLAMPEFARVLHPGGTLATSYFIRDDSVPWVRRLISLMRSVDPEAMKGDDQSSAIAPLMASRFFTRQASRDFRIWVPTARMALLDMVSSQDAVDQLETAVRTKLLDDVASIYSGAASANELRLPYQLRCWRATVDHTALSTALRTRPQPTAGLVINL